MRIAQFFVCALFFAVASASAQDVPLTQYTATPLAVNPALAGLIPGSVRASAVARYDWHPVGGSSIASYASADAGIMKGRLPDGDAMGIGLSGGYSNSGGGGSTRTTAGATISYHKVLGKDRRQHISVGVQGMMSGMRSEFDGLTFDSMYNVSTGTLIYNPVHVVARGSYTDVNAGIMYSRRIAANGSICAGYSQYHITQPVVIFSDGRKGTIPRHHNIYGSGSVGLGSNVMLYLNGLHWLQGSMSETILGASAGFLLGRDKRHGNAALFVGGRYRSEGAICPLLGFQYHGFRLGASYDMYDSPFSGQQALELSLSWAGGSLGKKKGRDRWFCPPIY